MKRGNEKTRNIVSNTIKKWQKEKSVVTEIPLASELVSIN